jgi:hypothetical protein
LPTVLREGEFVFRFWSHDHEPAHVHVHGADGNVCVEIASGAVREVQGMRERDVRIVQGIVRQNRMYLMSAWIAFATRRKGEA